MFSGGGGSTGTPFADDVCTFPWYDATTPPCLYLSTPDLYLFGWEASTPAGPGGTRRIECTAYLRATGKWTPRVVVGTVVLTDDDHGVPSFCADSNGYLYCFYGAHGDPFQVSVSAAPNDPTTWIARTAILNSNSYPHPYFITNKIWLFARNDATTTERTLALIGSTALSGTPPNPTWDAAKTIVGDMGADTRWYQGNGIISGTDIHMVATKANAADTIRQNVYYLVFDTLTGAVRNYASTFSVAAGSLPVTLTDLDANFKIYTHAANHCGVIPQFCFDTGTGFPHVIDCDGSIAGGGTYHFDPPFAQIKHLYWDGAAWQTENADSFYMTGRYDGLTIWPLASSAIGIAWAVDPSLVWTRGGQYIEQASRTSGGVWSGAAIALTATTAPVDAPIFMQGGASDVRFAAGEISTVPATEVGTLQAWAFGDNNAILNYSAATIPTLGTQFVAVGTASSGTNTNLTPALPVGWAAGQIAVAIFNARNPSGTIGTPAGWTAITGSPFASSTASKFNIVYRVLQGGDTAPTFTYSGLSNDTVIAQIATFSNPNLASPIGNIGTLYDPGVNGTTIGPITGLVGLRGQCVIIVGTLADDFSSGPLAVGGDYTPWRIVGATASTAGSDASMMWQCGTLYENVTVTSKTLIPTVASTGRAGIMFALNSAAN